MVTLNRGSSGNDVRRLQESLNSKGYNLDVDGVFGDQTLQAVRDFQGKNGLDVDGIVGNNTWGALTTNATTAPTQTTTPTTTQTPTQTPSQTTEATGFAYTPYEASDTVKQAEAMLKQQLSQKPGEYQSEWNAQINDTLNKILNREKFSYDLNGDALYQQYKDQYMLQGQQAMMDTMGQAAALTGGYGNSYAQTVGQQTYQGYLQQLNDRVPELYQLALDQYNREGDNLYNQYGMFVDRENQDYGRYRDQVGDYYTELDRLTSDARYQGEQDYGKWADKLNLDYGMYRDQIADQQWQAQFDEAKRQYDESVARAESESSSSSSRSTGGNGGGGYDANTAKTQQMLKDAGYDIVVDGIWGPKTQAAYDDYTGKDEDGGGGDPTGFTGTTYSEAVAFANSNGVPNSKSSSILTKSEFNRVKRGGGTRDGANEFDTYEEYLAYAVESMIDAYGNK